MQGPTRLLRLSRAYVQARALQLAVSKDLFTYLEGQEGGRSWEEIGRQLGFKTDGSFRGTRDFLDLLVSIEVLSRSGPPGEERYSNSPEASAFLVRDRPDYAGGYVAMEYTRTYMHASALEEALSTGEVSAETHARLGIPTLAEVFGADPVAGLHFAKGMSSVAAGNFRSLAKQFDFSRYSTLTDVGGSLGTLCLEVCARHPHLSARSCDLPTLHDAAEANVATHGLGGCVQVVDLDMFSEEPFPASDVVTMSQVLHDWGLPKKKLLMEKAFDALPPGGAFIAVERLIDDERQENTAGLAQSLVMLLNFGKEDAFDFSFGEFQGWAEEVGFKRCERLQLLPDWGAAVAYK